MSQLRNDRLLLFRIQIPNFYQGSVGQISISISNNKLGMFEVRAGTFCYLPYSGFMGAASCQENYNYYISRDLLLNVWFFTIEFNTLCHPDLRQPFFVTEEYHYLNVPRAGTYMVFDDFGCTYKCLSHPSCISLNLASSKGADGKLWCELLSSVKYDNPDEYKRNDTSHHSLITVGPSFSQAR